VLESHLLGCPRCQNEIDELRSLFTTLTSLPQFSPAPGFASRVMACVVIRRPWQARAGALVARLMPRTTPGWAFAVAMLAIPVLLASGLALWLLSKDYVTTSGLWAFATDRFTLGANRVASGVVSSAIQTDVMAWLVKSIATFLAAAGLRGLGTLAALLAMLTMLSIWVLYRNLVRTPTRGSTYVTYSF
jgi:hypothetical protein